QLDPLRVEMRRDDAAGVAVVAGLGEPGDHIRLPDRANGAERQKLRVAGSDPDADQPSRAAHRLAPRASALTAAAVTALPPSRPFTVSQGTPPACSASASFDSAAPTKPTG